MTGRFTVRSVASGIKFDLKAPNGQTLMTSEVYDSLAACNRGIASVLKNAPTAPVEDRTEANLPSHANPKFEVYQDKAGAYRFRLKARNGKVIGISDGYTTKANCLSGIDSIKENITEET